MRLSVLSPASTLLEVPEALSVQVQLSDGGWIGILPGHGPLLAETVEGPLAYADEAGEHFLELEAGILEVQDGAVTILTGGRGAGWRGMHPAPADEEQVRFDRLAQALFASLGAQPESEGDERPGA